LRPACSTRRGRRCSVASLYAALALADALQFVYVGLKSRA
jgi:hypothetical protein